MIMRPVGSRKRPSALRRVLSGPRATVAFMDERHVTTAADLDAMTPAERHEHFLAGTVDPDSLSPERRAAILARAEAVIADHEAREQQRAS